MSIFCLIDDKHIPLYRVMWVAATPHFCGDEECQREGFYEVRLEQDESVWANAQERDKMLAQIEDWQGDPDVDEPEADEKVLVVEVVDENRRNALALQEE